MTKPTKTPKVNWKVAPEKPSSSKYTVFYLILLIFTTITAAIGLTSFGRIGDSFQYLNSAPLLTCITFGQYISALLMVAGVVYLYKKRKDGLYLLFGAYAFTIITMIALPLASDPIITEAVTQITAQGGSNISRSDAETFTRIGLNIVVAVNIFLNVLFALLWQWAWNRQAKRDALLNKTSE